MIITSSITMINTININEIIATKNGNILNAPFTRATTNFTAATMQQIIKYTKNILNKSINIKSPHFHSIANTSTLACALHAKKNNPC